MLPPDPEAALEAGAAALDTTGAGAAALETTGAGAAAAELMAGAAALAIEDTMGAPANPPAETDGTATAEEGATGAGAATELT